MQITMQTGSKIVILKLNERVPVLKLFASIKSEVYSPCNKYNVSRIQVKAKKTK